MQDIALNRVRPVFAVLQGVSAPPPFGGNQRTIVIRLNPDQLNAYNMFLGDADYFDRDLQRYQAVTKAALQQAVADYLDPARRVTLSIVPTGRVALVAPNSEPAVVT